MFYTLYVFILSNLGQTGKVVAFCPPSIYTNSHYLHLWPHLCLGPSSLPTMNPSRTLHQSEMEKENVQMISSLVGSKPFDAFVASAVVWQEHYHLESACAAVNPPPGSNN